MLTATITSNDSNIVISIHDEDNLIVKATLIREQRVFKIKFGYSKIVKQTGKSLLLNKSGLCIVSNKLSAEAQKMLAETIKKELNGVDFITISEIEPIELFIKYLESKISIYKTEKSNLINYKINLSGGFQKYFDELNSKLRTKFSKEVRKFYGLFDGNVEVNAFTKEEHINQFMKDCTDIYNESWKDRKINNVKLSDVQRYVRNSEWLGYILYANKEPIAFYHGFVRDNQYALVVNGYKAKYRAYGPGKVLLNKMLELSDDEPYNIIDLGSGTSQYKRQCSNECHEIYSAYIAKKTSKFGVIFMMQTILDETYSRIRNILQKMKLDVYARRIVRGG